MGLETCRTCFSRILQNAYSLLDKSIGDMLQSLTCINIELIPEASTVICTKCYLNLKLAYRIQKIILTAEEKLQIKLKHSERTIVESVIVEQVPTIPNEAKPEFKPPESLITDSFCFICGSTPRSNGHFRAHFKKGQYCNICNSQFETFQSYKQHLPICQDELSYQCAKCQVNFRYKSLYDLHMEKLHSLRENVDGLIVKSESKEAQEETAKKKIINCGECGKQFKSIKSLQLHSHKTRKCPICEKDVLVHKWHYHLKDHEGPQICEICGAQMKNVHCLHQHILYSHNKARYKCEDCGKEFKKRNLFNLHVRKHKGQRLFTCETCGKSFYQKEFLQRHINMTHLKLRPHICQYCQKGFSSKYAMRTHERQHTNETPYRCEDCGEAFRQNVSLKAHRKSKHGITESETVKCEVCGKGFASQQALIGHARLHI